MASPWEHSACSRHSGGDWRAGDLPHDPEERVVGFQVKKVRQRERGFLIGNLLVRIHYIIVMIRWTGLAPWESPLFSLLLYSRYRSSRRSLSLKLSDTRVYEPQTQSASRCSILHAEGRLEYSRSLETDGAH